MQLWPNGRPQGLTVALAAMIATALAVGCDMTRQTGVKGSAGFAVVITDRHGFNPDSLDVPGGSAVTFGWDGANSRQHNVTFIDTSFVSPTQVYGSTLFAFGSGRKYHYQCTIHGEHGVIIAH